MWNTRLYGKPFNRKMAYAGRPKLFTIKLHHGGEFTKYPDRMYIHGKVTWVDYVDIDQFSAHEMDALMKGLQYSVPPVIYYHFLIPNGDFHFGLRPLGNDDDLLNLAQYVAEHKVIKVYTEQGETSLLTYFMDPRPVRKVLLEQIEEVEEVNEVDEAENNQPPVLEDVIPTTPKDHANANNVLGLTLSLSPEYSRKKNWNKDKCLSSCRKDLFSDDVEDVEKEHDVEVAEKDDVVEATNTEGGESNQAANEINSFDHENNDFDIDWYRQILENDVAIEGNLNEEVENDVAIEGNLNEEVETSVGTPLNDENDVDAFVEAYMEENGIEDEFMEQGQGDEEYMEEDGYFEAEDGDDSDDSDFWVDEENLIPNVEVDMRDFNVSIDTEVEFMERKAKKTRDRRSDNEEVTEEVEVIDNDKWDSLGEESDMEMKRRAVLKELGKEVRCSEGQVHKVSFFLGQKWATKKEIKDKIQLHALESRRNLHVKKNDKTRLRAICKGFVPFTDSVVVGPTLDQNSKSKTKSKSKVKGKGKGKEKDKEDHVGGGSCPWVLHASRSTEQDYWYVKTYNHEHTCLHTRQIKAATARFISTQIMDQVETNLTIPVMSLKDQMQKKYHVGFSIHKMYRARSKAKAVVVGDYAKQYEVLRDYILELQDTNIDTTVILDLVSAGVITDIRSRIFKRIYVCLGAMKKGFKAGMRDLLGLDGCFMKGPFSGHILTAVGVDSNNGIYPLAYAMVESECTDNWKWFLNCLGDDLDLHANSNFTFISDRQKGILQAITKIFPQAEHRFCVRHIYENMRQKWKTAEYKQHLWRCATATTIPEFNHYMSEFSSYNNAAYEWLKKISPHHWARSHFSGRPVSDMLLNNLCEVFNSKLVEGRDKPIITCLEYIREYMMKRICNVLKLQSKCQGPLTPNATKILEANCEQAKDYSARWNGSEKYQVKGPWQDQHVVDMGQRECSCRKWELTGIPCRHVIAVLYDKADHAEHVGELYTYVHRVHWLETWKHAYSFHVDPIKGRAMWPKSDCPLKITPPPHRNKPGRPKKKRRLTMEEKVQRRSEGASGSAPRGEGASGSAPRGEGASGSAPRGETSGVSASGRVPSGSGKLTRKFISVTCSKCKNKGHNARSCKGEGAGRRGAGN